MLKRVHNVREVQPCCRLVSILLWLLNYLLKLLSFVTTCRDDNGEIMQDFDASGMQRRSPGKKKIQRRNYISCGPNDTWHIGGIFLTEVINNMLIFIIVIADTHIVP